MRNFAWHEKFARGDQTPIYETDFSTSVGWLASNAYSQVASGQLQYLGSFDSTAYRSISGLVPGQMVVLRFTADASGLVKFADSVGGAISTEYGLNTQTLAVGPNEFVMTLTNAGADGVANFGIRGIATGPAFNIDNLEIVALGITAALDLREGGGFQPKNPRSGNGSGNFVLSTTGVSWAKPAPIGKRISITESFDHTEISSTTATTRLGWQPPGYGVVSVRTQIIEAFDSGTTLRGGTGALSTQFASGLALDSVGFDGQDSADKNPVSASSNGSIFLTKSGATTQGQVVVTFILERVF